MAWIHRFTRAADCRMHGGHVIFVISGSSFRWVCSSIPDPTTHASLAAIPIFVLVVAAGGCRCARARNGDRAGSCQMTGAVGVRESRPANPYDNATCESFLKTLKREEIHASAYRDFEGLQGRVEEFIDRYYNRCRLHSALRYSSPEEFEKRTQTREKEPCQRR